MKHTNIWADQIFAQLSPKQRIAQLFHVKALSNLGEEHTQEILKLIEIGIGGGSFFQGTAPKQAELTNLYQSKATVPLLIAIDAEWGLAMRLDNIKPLPYNMTLGACDSPELVEKIGEKIGEQLRTLGVHINFAPVSDINNNPDNPVINFRSFGENKEKVAQNALAYMRGLQKKGVLAVAKHFPGHGDTATDSHLGLPIIHHSGERISNLEMYPFQELIKNKIGGIMTAHIQIPSLDDSPNTPATLSPKIIQKILKEELHFEGLVFTDALDMKGIADFVKQEEVAIRAIEAGNDVLLLVRDVEIAIAHIQEAIQTGRLHQEQIDKACYKQLVAKQNLGLDQLQEISLDNLEEKLNQNIDNLCLEVARKNSTVLKGANLLPLDVQKAASLSIGADDQVPTPHSASNLKDIAHHGIAVQKQENLFQTYLKSKKIGKTFQLSRFSSTLEFENISAELAQFDFLIVSLHNLGMKPTENFGITENLKKILQKLSELRPKILFCLFGNPYILNQLDISFETVLLAYQSTVYQEKAAAEVILGENLPTGKLPVRLNFLFDTQTNHENTSH